MRPRKRKGTRRAEMSKRPAKRDKGQSARPAQPRIRNVLRRAAATTSSLRIVGIGASAGGLSAFRAFFGAMPANSGAAYILVQHLDPTHKSSMGELIAKTTAMPVVQAADGLAVLPNHVYMIQPGEVLTLRAGGLLRVLRARDAEDRTGPVTLLFESLARECKAAATVVVLSGMGSDGAAGVRAVKKTGGYVLVQSPDSAQATGMPESSMEMADDVAAPEAMPRLLIQHWEMPRHARGGKSDLSKIERILRERTNHDFSNYKRGTIRRRVERRMALRQLRSVDGYAKLLRANSQETDDLFKDLLIGVTEFFREPESWVALQKSAIAKILERAGANAAIRVWVPGCATGQEAYSMAIVFLEQMRSLREPPDLKILATDLNPHVLEIARNGTYSGEMLKGVSPERLRTFFTKLSGDQGYRISKDVREHIVFAEQSLTADPPFSKLDLISCRNVLIYLEAESQRKVISLFHFALASGGFLFLGNSESVGNFEPLLQPISKKWRIYQRVPNRDSPAISFLPARPNTRQTSGPSHEARTTSSHERLAHMAQRLVLEQLAPASVLVDTQGYIHYYCGPTHEYLIHPTGAPTNELFQIVRPGLRAKLREGLRAAAQKLRSVAITKLRVRRGDRYFPMSVRITPVNQSGEQSPLFLIVFDERQLGAAANSREAEAFAAGEESVVRQLEYDIRVARDDLQASIEEFETTNEELKAANEEAMSVNEELQSSNEELETSKEELQSLNEELTTVNNQLHSKVDELEEANNDLENLVASSDLATIFLDRHFRIRRFTPAIRQIVRLLPSDIGRPIVDFAQMASDSDLIKDSTEVLRTLVPRETQIRATDGRSYLRRVLPYRTDQDRIDGVVITFVDVTERASIDEARARLGAIVDSSEDAIVSKTLEGIITSWNGAAVRLFGYSEQEAIGRSINMIIPDDRMPEEISILDRIRHGHRVDHFETERVGKGGKRVNIDVAVSPVKDSNGRIIGASKIARDISQRKAAEEHQRMLVAELDHRVKNTLAVVTSLATQTIATSQGFDDFAPAFEGRIQALSGAHKLLSQRMWKGTTLAELIEQVVHPLCRERRQCLSGESEVLLPARAALSLSLMLHELATNASKYGALSTSEGTVQMTWNLKTEGARQTLHFTWTEMSGPTVTPPTKAGFGSTLLRRCVEYEFQGKTTIEFLPEGLRCTIVMHWTDVPITGVS
ncbi:MAG: CheR family methyltransferase [Phycisphaerales bacterium]